MQFIDEARLLVKGGRGGDGSVSFNREKYKPHGGPDGGTGGDGGSVIVSATGDLSTLEPYIYRRVVKAGRGGHGSGNNRAGERGEDVILEAPVGTLVFFNDGLLADLSRPGEQVVVARGGGGGRGNSAFATSTRQAPAFAEKGLPGEDREILLELRALSDVGLVGLPNAGKSSLLSRLTAAHPKVGDYPFTTLTPQLGIVDRKTYRKPFAVADIPGLIAGASEGRGLGNRFLRHVARARLLVLVLDASEDPEASEATLRAELKAAGLSSKPAMVILNKVDLLDDELREYLLGLYPGALLVSALTGEGVQELRDLLEERLREINTKAASSPDITGHRVFRPAWRGIRVERVDEGVYQVSGETVKTLVLRTDWNNLEGVDHFQRELERKGVVAALKKAGAEPGDEIHMEERVFDLQ